MPELKPDPSELKPLERSVFGRLATLVVGAWSRLHGAWLRWAALNQHTPAFPWIVAGIVAIDSAVVLLPGDLIVALALLSNPQRWRKLAFASGLGGALGAFGLFLVISHYGKAPLDDLAALSGHQSADLSGISDSHPDIDQGIAAVTGTKAPKWEIARNFFKKYGLFSLALGSVLPLLSWPPVVLAGLSTDRWWEVLFWLLIGRQARYWLLCFGLREGWAMFRAIKDEAQHKREKKED